VPIEVIPCCADLRLFNSSSVESRKTAEIRAHNSLKGNEFILSYIGSLGTWYMPEEMMRFFKRLLLRKPDAIFFIVTHDNPKIIFDLAKKFDVPERNLRTAEARRKEVPAYISISAVSIFFIKPVFSKKASSPTKQGEIMGMGVPIVCNSGVGDTDMVIKKYHAGWVTNQFTDAEFDRVISDIDAPLSREEIVRGAQEFYSLEEGVKRYRSIYNAVRGIKKENDGC
jgi:glycosyltransferase involved in cell wall biosynthesis